MLVTCMMAVCSDGSQIHYHWQNDLKMFLKLILTTTLNFKLFHCSPVPVCSHMQGDLAKKKIYPTLWWVTSCWPQFTACLPVARCVGRYCGLAGFVNAELGPPLCFRPGGCSETASCLSRLTLWALLAPIWQSTPSGLLACHIWR